MEFTTEQLELLNRFDNPWDSFQVLHTFRHVGIPWQGSEVEYIEAVNKLRGIVGAPTPQPSRGLGDTIAKITHATGLDKLSELYTQVTGKDCGCASRQEALNKLVPYGANPNG
jgi:hypothetical protein